MKRARPANKIEVLQKTACKGLANLGNFFLSLALSSSFCLSTAAQARELEASITDNLSSELGIPLYSWSPGDPPKAVIVAIHGATLHGRSYTTIAQRLSQKGYAVFAPDMRGFGAWYHNSDDPEDFAKHVLYRQSEADLKNLLDKLHKLYPGKPIFIMGESVGANFAIRLLASYPNCADGMILSSPAIKQRLIFGPTVLMQALTVFFVNPGAQLDVTPFLRTRVSEDQKITNERINDPLGRNKMNVGELFKTRWFNKDCMKLVPQLPNNIAVLVIEGADDKLFHADDINNLMSTMPCQDKTLHLLKNRGHINLETQFLHGEVETTLEGWLAEKSSKYVHEPSNHTTVSAIESGAAP